MPPEQSLDQWKMRATEDRTMRSLTARLRQKPEDTDPDQPVQFRLAGLFLDGSHQLGADLLHDLRSRAALADLLAIDLRGNGAGRAKHGDKVGVVLLRILRRRHRPRRLGGGFDR